VAKVSLKTRKKVEAFLSEDKFAPNMGAMILASSNSRIIGVIMFMKPRRNETVLEDPFSSAILGAMEAEIRTCGYFLMLHTTSDEDEVIRLSKTWKLAGLVLLWVPGMIGCLIRRSIDTPLVFVDSYFQGVSLPCHNVGLDDFAGGYMIANHILAMGHRRAVFLANDNVYLGGDRKRFEGCTLAFEERKLALTEDAYIVLSKDPAERFDLYRRISDHPSDYSALLFSADYYAAEAVSFLADHGTRVPEDISITGFDDNIFSMLIRPRLTTIHQDVYLKGKKAVEMLMQLVRGEDAAEPDVRLPVRLVIRDSVAKV
jgi:LacI family transcriptional regulator